MLDGRDRVRALEESLGLAGELALAGANSIASIVALEPAPSSWEPTSVAV